MLGCMGLRLPTFSVDHLLEVISKKVTQQISMHRDPGAYGVQAECILTHVVTCVAEKDVVLPLGCEGPGCLHSVFDHITKSTTL